MKPHYVVVGAGISGLSLGWFLKKRFADVAEITILESGKRPGGWIQTHHDKGFLFEAGPRSCRTHGNGVETLKLVEALGLQEEVISASPAAQRRFLYTAGALHQLPNSLWTFLTSPLMSGVLPALWKDVRTARGERQDETISDFIGRRLSPELAERLFDPLVSGIYAGDMHRLSIRSCFPELYRLEQEYGSLVRGMFSKKKTKGPTLSPFVKRMLKEPIFSFRRGMESLVTGLQATLKKELRLGCGAHSLKILPEAIEVITSDRGVLTADRVFFAVPGDVAASLLKTIEPQHLTAPLLCLMGVNPSASVAVVNLGWRDNVLNHKGFGYLIPTREKENILGVVWDAAAFPQQNSTPQETRLTVMLGGMHRPDMEKISCEQATEHALQAISKHLTINHKPDAVQVTLARRAIPQYELGHYGRLSSLQSSLSMLSAGRIQLVGSAWHGVAVNDCIANSKRVVEGL